MLAHVLNAVDVMTLMAIAYREATCECGSTAQWLSCDEHLLLCGRCRRNDGSDAVQVGVIRDVLRDLAQVYGAAYEEADRTNRILPVPVARIPHEIGAYVLGDPCGDGNVMLSPLGCVVAMLAQGN